MCGKRDVFIKATQRHFVEAPSFYWACSITAFTSETVSFSFNSKCLNIVRALRCGCVVISHVFCPRSMACDMVFAYCNMVTEFSHTERTNNSKMLCLPKWFCVIVHAPFHLYHASPRACVHWCKHICRSATSCWTLYWFLLRESWLSWLGEFWDIWLTLRWC